MSEDLGIVLAVLWVLCHNHKMQKTKRVIYAI